MQLFAKMEECASLEQYKEKLTTGATTVSARLLMAAEMDDLTTTLFEEAHEMVRKEKVGLLKCLYLFLWGRMVETPCPCRGPCHPLSPFFFSNKLSLLVLMPCTERPLCHSEAL